MEAHPQDFINRHRCYVNPQYLSQGHSLKNSLNFQSLHNINPINGSSSKYIADYDFPNRGLQSEKYIRIPVQFSTRGKEKRNTLPVILTNPSIASYGKIPSRSNQTTLNPKIKFTYCSPTSTSGIFFPSSMISTSSSQIQQIRSKTNVLLLSKKESKKLRNKLASLEFSFAYYPKQKEEEEQNNTFQKIISKSQSCQSIVEQEKTSIILPNKNQENIRKLANDSKVASTIATQSFYNQSRKSDFASHQNTKNIDNSKIYFGSNQKSNLMDQIPQAKQLRQTVILTNNDYSFGGILEKKNPFEYALIDRTQEKKAISRECELRQWNSHVKCLIDNRESQDLKQSIHEGPDIRLERHKFDMLDGFGREIKESTMSIYQ